MSNIQLKLSENKKIKYLEQKVVGRIGEKNLTTIDVYLQKADFKTPYVIPTDATVKFIAETNTNNYTDGYASIVDREKGFIQYTFTEDNFSDSSGKGKRPFKAAYFELETSDGNRVTFQDFEVYVLPRADISADQATYYVSSLEKILSTFQVTFDQFIIDNTVTYDEFYEKYNNLIRRINESDSKADDVVSKVNAALIEFETGDFFNKQESSANVINSIGGAESAILKKELLVNGIEGTASRYAKDLSTANNYVLTNAEGKPSMDNYVSHSRTSSTVNNGILTIKKISAETESDAFYQIGYIGTTNKLPIKNGQRWVFGGKVKGKGMLQVFYRLKGETNYSSNKTLFDTSSFEAQFTEITVPDNVDALAARFRFQDNAPTNSTFDVKDVFFKVDNEKYSPAPEDYGIVHGQPNLLNGTSNEWKEYTFSGWQATANKLNVADLGLKPGDTVTMSSEINNTGSVISKTKFVTLKSDNTVIAEVASNSVQPNTSGISVGSLSITADTAFIQWYTAAKLDATTGVSISTRKHKLIKGSGAAMDEWTPSQSDSGLTIVNNGMVPFTDDEYNTLLSDDGVVRGENLDVGYGAGIDFDFPVLNTLEEKYSYLFEDLSSTSEKRERLLSILKSVTVVHNSKGGGLPAYGQVKNYFSKPYIKKKTGGWNGVTNSYNDTSDFKSIEGKVPENWFSYLSDDGNYTFSIVSQKRNMIEGGCISDGVTPAWVEVKDIRLIIEVETNGRTIIEYMIAANHRENLATQDEAEEGLNESKTMTPVRVFQAIAKWIANKFVSVAGNETILGIKNFTGGLLVSDKRVLTVDDILQTSGTIPLINGNTGVLKYTKQLKNVTLTFNGLNGKYGGTPSGSTLANLPADLRPANYFEELVGSTDRGAVNTAALSFATTGEINWQRNSSTASDYSFEVTYQTI